MIFFFSVKNVSGKRSGPITKYLSTKKVKSVQR